MAPFTRVDRYLSTLQLRQAPVYMPSERFPRRPMIGLLVRLVYQHYSQAMDAALREAGFDDIGPSAGNVFPFVGPEGITVSELAELAHVRKQTMAQAVEQLERTGYVKRRPNPNDRRSQLIFLTERGQSVPPVTHALRSSSKALGCADQPEGAGGPSEIAATLLDQLRAEWS